MSNCEEWKISLHIIRVCNTWNTYVIYILFVASGRCGYVGRTGLGVVLHLFLCVSDMLCMSSMVWYWGLLSLMCCSGIRCLWWWWLYINSCSKGSSIVGFVTCFKTFIVSVSDPYSCRLLRKWSAWADCGSVSLLVPVLSVGCRVSQDNLIQLWRALLAEYFKTLYKSY